ncbi:MAG: MFS transporter [Ardenticatenales bacterium]|nr:MFS transporter [Ardenticatenales bacterium]
MSQHLPLRGMAAFLVVWLGQVVSLIGSGLTRFGLTLWVLEHTGSVTQFSLILFFSALPGGLIIPIAGVLSDRFNRRHLMIVSDTVAALGTVIALLLILGGRLAVWHIYLITTIQTAASLFQRPAYMASVPLLVPQAQLGRASGLLQVATTLPDIISPIVAGALIGFIGLNGLVAIDLITFLFALVTLALVVIPKPARSQAGAAAAQASFAQDIFFGWRYIRARSGFLQLLLYVAAINLVFAMFEALLPPLILSMGDERTLGIVLSLLGASLLLGSLIMAAWGGPRRRVFGVLTSGFAVGVGIFVLGWQTSPWLVAGVGFVALLSVPIMSGCSQAFWLEKVEPDIQGRVSGIRMVVGTSTLPIGFLLAGLFADYVFNPLLTSTGPLASLPGVFFGIGPQRGISLLLVVIGVLTILVTLAGLSSARLRLLDRSAPDAALASAD